MNSQMDPMNDYNQPPQNFQPNKSASVGLSMISAVIGGAVVAAVVAVLIVTGVIDGKETTVVNSGGVATKTATAGELKTVGAIYKKTSPGVVAIRASVASSGSDLFGNRQEGTASGTGFVISDDGFVVTNAHVVDGARGDVTVTFNDEKSAKAKVVGSDDSNDIAVLKVDPDDHDLTPIELGDSSKVAVGDPVVAIGNPFGLSQTVTTGIVSALQRTITAPNNFSINNVIQTDAAINPGNSGGPLLDGSGRVIGVNSQIATSGGNEGNVGIGFAVPIDTVKKIVPQLEKDGKVEYAYLGVSTGTLSPAAAEKLNFDGRKEGAVVACVVDGGPADKAGLRGGGNDTVRIDGQEFPIDADLIVRIDETEVKSSDDIQTAVLAKQPGDEIKITYIRDGKEKTTDAKLGKRPESTSNNCSAPSEQQQEPQQPQLPDLP